MQRRRVDLAAERPERHHRSRRPPTSGSREEPLDDRSTSLGALARTGSASRSQDRPDGARAWPPSADVRVGRSYAHRRAHAPRPRAGGPPSRSARPGRILREPATAHVAPSSPSSRNHATRSRDAPGPHVGLQAAAGARLHPRWTSSSSRPTTTDPGPRRLRAPDQPRAPPPATRATCGELLRTHPPSVPRVGLSRGEPHDRRRRTRRSRWADRPALTGRGRSGPGIAGHVTASLPRHRPEQRADGAHRLDQVVAPLGLLEVREAEHLVLGLGRAGRRSRCRGSSVPGSRRRASPRASRSGRRCGATPA